MKKQLLAALIVGTALAVSAPANALQCVPFARDVSGISIRGDAWTWWSSADGLYDRGHAPRIGAVVVFQKTKMMRHGHVAVVTDVVNSREVLVDHANWGSRRIGGRGQVAKGMSVVDISPKNDWTQVRVWNRRSGEYGTRTYPTYGFIYAPGSRAVHLQMASFIPEPPKTEISRAEQARIEQTRVAPTAVAAPTVAAATSAPAAPMQRLGQHGDAKLATADLQIAALLSAPTHPAKAEQVEGKSPAAAAELPLDDDQAMARRFGSGHY